ncbi:MAG TPA: VCBS repeat-containing protein [Desulfurivibrio alkaliphilus]|uniref:VCBS repeat-containing protein n=1 Tax=Desulfurivibrio alkaliphilus TaxID=427923 RepID=A0A7C2XB16_9BACT|nr:VCBS repeat-containing protein [Desulfurivibrio alkaliphilus]
MTRTTTLLVLFSLLLLFSPPAGAGSEPPPKVAVLPIELQAPQDLAYLVNGVRTMLGSRLAMGGRAQLLDRSEVEQALAGDKPQRPAEFRLLGEKLGANYLLTGSLTALGGSVSLDTVLHEVGSADPPRYFSAIAPTEGEVIAAVDRLASEIRAALAGEEPPAAPAPLPAPLPDQGQPAYISPHPARQLPGRASEGSPFIRAGEVSRLQGLSKSHDIPLGLRAMDAGDLTGDGATEFVLAGSNRVEIYRRLQGRFVRVGQVSTLNRYPIHYISLADLNGDGRAEIVISASDERSPSSLIVAWNGNEFVPTHTNIPWYIRAMSLPMEGAVLVGQRAAAGGDIVRPGLFRLELLADGSVEQGSQLATPGRLNLFDFIYVDLDDDGIDEIVAITQNNRMEVLSAGGARLWISEEQYGGTTRFLGGFDSSGHDPEVAHKPVHLFVPGRIVSHDVTRDGLPDIVINRNISALPLSLGRLRSYSAGEVHALSWDGHGMNEIWRTRRIEGYVADIQVGPGDEGTELFVGVVPKSDGLGIRPSSESAIYVYPMLYNPE